MENETQGALLVGQDNTIWSDYDDSRLKELPWYKQWYTALNKHYRDRFIDIIPIEITTTLSNKGLDYSKTAANNNRTIGKYTN
jgi:hypothetical protein